MPKVKYQISIDEPRWKKSLPEYKNIITKSLSVIPGLTGDPSDYYEADPRSKAGMTKKDKAGMTKGVKELSILLTNDSAIKKLNKTYRGKDKPTNVLSFPNDEPGFLGDIAMALETLEREAIEQEKTFSDHFTHLFIHGVLHLLGYDHELGKKQQDEMEALEIKILKILGIYNPY